MTEREIIAQSTADEGVTATLYSDGVMLVEFPRGTVVDIEVAKSTRELQFSVSDGPYVVVADATRIAYFDKEAREYLSTDDRHLQLANAVIVGPRISKYVVERWVTDYELDRPVGMFFTADEAFEWARKKAAELLDRPEE